MSYLLIVMITVVDVTTAYVRVLPDAVVCVAEADTVRQKMNSVESEWILRTRCVPIPEVTEV